jgi:hypothetical protein
MEGISLLEDSLAVLHRIIEVAVGLGASGDVGHLGGVRRVGPHIRSTTINLGPDLGGAAVRSRDRRRRAATKKVPRTRGIRERRKGTDPFIAGGSGGVGVLEGRGGARLELERRRGGGLDLDIDELRRHCGK